MSNNELPSNWDAGIGERGSNHYTKNYYNPSQGIEVRQYTDPNEPHTIVIRKIEEKPNGDIVDKGLFKPSDKLDSESAADKKAMELMEKHNTVE